MRITQIIFLFLFGFNLFLSIGCSETFSISSVGKKPDPNNPTNPEFKINPPLVSPGNSTSPGFIIKQLPNVDLTISLFRGPLLESKCQDSDLIPLGDPISVSASQNEIVIDNLGNILNTASDGTYVFFAKVEGEGISTQCIKLTYVFDTTKPEVVNNTSGGGTTLIANDDTPGMSKTWEWACQDATTTCTYRHRIDDSPLTETSCPVHTFSSSEAYSDVSTDTKAGGDGKYCIHIQAKDEAGNESDVVSVYATLDNTSPVISSVTIPSKTYAGGERMNFTVTFSEAVRVNSECESESRTETILCPRISLTFNGGNTPQTKYAEYYDGSGSTGLIFRYEVTRADSDTDGIEMADSIDLNSGTLQDEVGNSVSPPLTFTRPTNLSDVVVNGSDPGVVLSKTDLSVNENGGTGTYTVKLNSAPSETVRIALSSGDTGLVTVSPASLTFEVDNNNNNIWSSPQTVTVTGVNDSIDNDVGDSPRRSTDISYQVTSSDSDYDGLSVSPVGVTSLDDDSVGSIQLTVNPTSVNENSGTARVGVTAEFQGGQSGGQSNANVRLSDNLTISVSVGVGTAQAEDFNEPSPFNIVISAGSASGTGSFNLTVVDDEVDDDNETLLVNGSNSSGLNLGISSATLTIVDNDEGGVTLSRSSLSVGENGGTGTYTVKLESEPTGPVKVDIVSNDRTVVTVSPASLTFETDNNNNKIWSSPQLVTVTGVNDDIDNNVGNSSERSTSISHNVTSTDTYYRGLSVGSVEATSLDDDDIGSIQLTVNPTSVNEDGSPARVGVTAEFKGGQSGGQSNTNVRLSDNLTISTSVGVGTAQAEDFTAVSNFNIVISAGRASGAGSFNLTVVDDEVDDDDETLLVNGSNSSGLDVSSATLTIIDNDEKEVTLSRLSLSVGENGGTGTYTVRLSSPPSGVVRVVLSSGDKSLVTVSPASLTFEADNNNNKIWSSPQTVTVTGVNDDIDNDVGNLPRRSTDISHQTIGSDSDYNSLSVSPVEVTSVDDDSIGSIQLTVNPTSVNEDDGTASVEVTAEFQGGQSGGQSNTNVRLFDNLTISTSVGVGTAQVEDFTAVSNFNIVISAGSTSETGSFNLTVVDDEVDDDDETLLVRGSTSVGLGVSRATLTIVDNDEKGVTLSHPSLSVGEDGGTGTYTVKLDSEPTGPVRVNIVSRDGTVATVSPASLTFEADNNNNKIWSSPQPVTVTGVNESSTNSRHTTITHTVSGGGYDGISVGDLPVTSRDSTVKVIINNAADILADNHDDYSVGGVCLGSESVSVQVGDMSAESADCTNGEWLAEDIDTSTDVSNGPVTITVTQSVSDGSTPQTLSATANVTKCVSSGDGTSLSSPHWICNYNDLKNMFSETTRQFFVLGMDIDARASWSEGDTDCGAYDGTDIHDTSPCSGWTPLSYRSTGGFDGQNHKISNLYIHSSEVYVGLFGSLSIDVSNLHLRDVHVHSTTNDSKVGGIAGTMFFRSDIKNCSVTGIVSSSGNSSYVGGLVGRSQSNTINSYADVEVSSAGEDSETGGLVGRSESDTFIMSSYSRGSVTINSDSGNIGGLVGRSLVLSFYSSYSHASVSGGEISGGLVGKIEFPNAITISHSYSLGSGSPDDPLFDSGDTDVQNTSNLFWDTDVSEENSSEAPDSTGLTTANMQLACSNNQTTGICALGSGFSFSAGSYPKVRKCTTCTKTSPVFGDILEGQ